MDRKDGFPWFFGVIPWFPMVFPWVIWAIHHFGLLSNAPLQDAMPSFPAFPPPPGKMQRGKKGVLARGKWFDGSYSEE